MHPEQHDDEIFMGNFVEDGFREMGWHSKRKGSVAYDKDGEIILDSSLFPGFVSRSEVEAARNSALSPASRQLFQNMLNNGFASL